MLPYKWLAFPGYEYDRVSDSHVRIRQSRADDLRLFVEVLTTFCDDPRDAVEARAGEARARQQLADVQRQLEAAGTQAVEVSRGLPGQKKILHERAVLECIR